MTTKRVIAEQVMFRIEGGYNDTASPIKYFDIFKAMEQKINADFKMQHFQMTLASGDTIPEFAMIATYDDITLSTYKNVKSICTLPVIPISLPRGMGVLEIYSPDYPNYLFIPLQAGQANLLRSQELINDLLGQIGYTPYGNKIIFEKNLLLMRLTTVSMRLLVMDFSTYSETDPLNLPPDYESMLVEYLISQFAPVQQGDKLVDVYTQQPKQ